MGCCCRHDSAIYMGNIFKSGEQRCLPIAIIDKLISECGEERKFGILYDIGCSLDKYMGALDYHPRYNTGWGLSDGEGLERLWSSLSKLVSQIYVKDEEERRMKNCLRGPEIFLATEEEVNDLLASILELSENLWEELNELTGEQDMRGVMNDEESKLLLLLWSAKADLFVQAVHIQAEKRPLLESKSIGARLGTKLKEKIYKALQARQPAVKKYIDAFNRCFANYVTKFPNQKLSDAADYPLTYDNFVTFEIDHWFWNDGLYYHSKAPWAIDCDVCAGITETLTLSRVQEELQLLAQELCRAVGWGVAYYN
ncbi:hypothetical protein PTTG_26459 [Puccinia triticina 1-1 BBBD Race 1]|uniref:Uncharacterized protein n=1 Tax=Puccinia triticina (isolate 1-1 / race 1 (BBBD)) TaxID=630390 RepID=A0A180GUM9_PUCT1|nr:hypothetical protein PTTG_26459 [Puccinia triticina 1-1 BBBD Race 1]